MIQKRTRRQPYLLCRCFFMVLHLFLNIGLFYIPLIVIGQTAIDLPPTLEVYAGDPFFLWCNLTSHQDLTVGFAIRWLKDGEVWCVAAISLQNTTKGECVNRNISVNNMYNPPGTQDFQLSVPRAKLSDSGNHSCTFVVSSTSETINLNKFILVNVSDKERITFSTSTESQKHSEKDVGNLVTGAAVGGVIGGCFVIAVVGLYTYRRKYGWVLPFCLEKTEHPRHNAEVHVYETPRVVKEEGQAYSEITSTESIRSMDDITLVRPIGQGHFGRVWQAEYKKRYSTARELAVKVLKENATEIDLKDFTREIEIMLSLLPHENVIKVLGYSKSVSVFIALEFMANGSLKTFLRSSRSENIYGNLHGGSNRLTSRDLLTFAEHVANGMSHVAKYGFLHRDLAARNILVSESRVCKVADFGLARDVIESREYLSKLQGPLPVRWMAPESLSDSVYTTKSDVWAFGILLWEIVTLGATPYPTMVSARELLKEIDQGYRMEKPKHCTPELYKIMTWCWEQNPERRPTFEDLVVHLEKLLREEMTTHVDLNRFSENAYGNIENRIKGEIL